MKLKPSLILPLSALIILLAGSCRKEEQPYSGLFSHSFLYYGSAYNNLDIYISENVSEMARGTLPSISEDKAVFAFIHTTDSHGDYTTPGKAVLLRLYTKNGANTIDTVKVYQQPVVSSEPEMIRRVLLDADEICKARTHGFLFSSHATGFLPKGYSKKSERAVTLGFSEDVPAIPGTAPFYENDPAYPVTKSIGAQYIGSSLNSYQMNLEEFALAFPFKMDYIILDACLCGGVEVACELSPVCDLLIASPTEIICAGYAYSTLCQRLMAKEGPDLEGVCKDYFEVMNAVSDSYLRSATISLIDCRQLEQLKQTCGEIFLSCREGLDRLGRNWSSTGVQKYFYDSKSYFFDLRDIARLSDATPEQLDRLDAALDKAVPYFAHTASFFDSLVLENCCGLSVYLPQENLNVLNGYYRTLAWNKATNLVK